MYSLDDLAEMSHLKPSTVRQYIYRGLLPPARSTGPGKHYGPEHVRAIKNYRKLIPQRGNRLTRECIADATEFGVLHERIKEHIQRLQSAV